MIAVTIVSRAYVPHARVLARSYAAHHPGDELWALLIDDVQHEVVDSAEPFRVLHLDDLDLDLAEIHRMAMLFGDKIIAAIKPWVFEYFLARGAQSVLYLDGDFVIYDDLYEIGECAAAKGVVVVPHVLEPIPRDGRLPDDSTILGVGIYNAGMFGVGQSGRPFVHFLQDRLSRECRTDVTAMRVNEQRWLDFVPALFEHGIVKDPGVDVAPWNVYQRELTLDGNKFLTLGSPLRAFHFSGFDPRASAILSARDYWDDPRIRVEELPALRDLVERYRSDLLAEGFEEASTIRFAFDFLADGSPIPGSLRTLFATNVALADADSQRGYPPDPFDPRSIEDFKRWATHAYGDARLTIPAFLASRMPDEMRWRYSDLLARLNTAEAGQRDLTGVIKVNPDILGFVAYGPRAVLTAGSYEVIIESSETHTLTAPTDGDAPARLVVADISLDGYILACSQVEPNCDSGSRLVFDISPEMEALSLSAGIDVRVFSHGGSEASLEAAYLGRRADAEAAPASHASSPNWLLEMVAGEAGKRQLGQIEQREGKRGFVAMGPHWRLAPGFYTAALEMSAEKNEQVTSDVVITLVEAVTNGEVIGCTPVTFEETNVGPILFNFNVPDGRDVRVEFRVRGGTAATISLSSLFVHRQSADEGEPVSLERINWLAAMWASDIGRRVGAEIHSLRGGYGILAYGPHWSLKAGRYSATVLITTASDESEVLPDDQDGGVVEVVVAGRVEGQTPLRIDGTRTSAEHVIDFRIPEGSVASRDVELRIVPLAGNPIAVRSVRVRSLDGAS